MKFAIIDPVKMTVEWAEAKEPWELYPQIGLPVDGGVDHGVVLPWHEAPGRIGIAIIVDQFSLYVPPEHQRYYRIGRQLFGGAAILYGYQEDGESTDLPGLPLVVFMTVAGIENAIARGEIDRPYIAINNEAPLWQWPEPSPFPIPMPDEP
jgi:hypothetical protein